jgi:ferritin
MAKKNLMDALNRQIAMEEYASRSYLALALWADEASFEGAAAFFYKQAEEEREHMMKFIRFILDIGGSPVISTFPEELPKAKSFKDLFEIGLKHEKAVTKSIHKMYDMAMKDKDYPVVNFLNWFVEEQVEEEDQFNTILDKINLMEKHGGSIYLFDRELARMAAQKQ